MEDLLASRFACLRLIPKVGLRLFLTANDTYWLAQFQEKMLEPYVSGEGEDLLLKESDELGAVLRAIDDILAEGHVTEPGRSVSGSYPKRGSATNQTESSKYSTAICGISGNGQLRFALT